MEQNINNTYLYAFLDPRKPGKYSYTGLSCSFLFEPFYIGISRKNKRLSHHLKEKKETTCNLFKFRKICKIKNTYGNPIQIKIFENLNKKDASRLEQIFISEIGRMNLNGGPLTNRTDGGEGCYREVSKEERIKMSNIQKNYIKNNPTHIKNLIESNKKYFDNINNRKLHSERMKGLYAGNKNPNYGKKHSPETIEIIRQKKLEYYKNIENRKKISEKNKKYFENPENIKKHSKILSDYNKNPENKEKISNSHKGKKCSLETRIKMSESRKGTKNGMYGKKHTKETIQKIIETQKRNKEKLLFKVGSKL